MVQSPRVISCLLAFTFASIVRAEAVGTWELVNFTRAVSKDSRACEYSFTIIESDNDGYHGGPTSCSLQVLARNGKWANQTSFYGTPCSSDPNYQVSGGWDPKGFMTITVQNIGREYDTFFGYLDTELANGAIVSSKNSTAYTVGTLRSRSTSAEIEERASDDFGPFWLGYMWSINGMTRKFDTTTGWVNISFVIIDGYGNPNLCAVSQHAYFTDAVNAMSFYNVPCAESPYVMSWGYNQDTDSATMTVCGPDHHSDAFFGYSNLNTTTDFGNLGPFPVWNFPC